MRRQGRAAIAAQAAAESCLEAVQAQAADASEASETRSDASDEAARWLRARDPRRRRRRSPGAAGGRARCAPKRTLLQRLFEAPAADDRHARAALAEGLRLLRAQLEGTLHDLGVAVDRRTGDPVDAERQRVVEVRPPRPHERAGTVVEVVRPGYALGARIIREAEVVIAAGSER